ncbi:MAG: triose-phosphate isomerase [Leptospirales bacterium]
MMFLVANWKMNVTRSIIDGYLDVLASASMAVLLEKKGLSVAIAAPHIYLDYVSREVHRKFLPVQVIAQDVSTRTSGAFTGEVGVPNLLDIGVKGSLVGHSERRRFFRETDEDVVVKTGLCLNAGVIPIICFGESAHDRETGLTLETLKNQIAPVCEEIVRARDEGVYTPFYLAYEPVWAIGSGVNAGPDDIREVVSFVSEAFPWPDPPNCLYGGSVSLENIQDLASLEVLSGFLVGSSWLDPHVLLHSAELIPQTERSAREGVRFK